MDVIDEESTDVGSYKEFPETSFVSEYDESVDESESSATDFSEDESDFAKRLKKHRKELMDGDGRLKKKEDFSQKLRKHRDHLVTSWVHDEDGSEVPANVNGGDATLSQGSTVVSAGTGGVHSNGHDHGGSSNPAESGDDFNVDEISKINGLEQTASKENGISDNYLVKDQPGVNQLNNCVPLEQNNSGGNFDVPSESQLDGFGDFGTSSSNKPEQTKVMEQNSNAYDAFDDLVAAPVNPTTEALERSDIDNENNADVVGDVDGAADSQMEDETEQKVINGNGILDEFSSFEEAPTTTEPQLVEGKASPVPAAKDSDKAEEMFGDFDASVTQQEQSSRKDAEINFFGDFDTPPAEAPKREPEPDGETDDVFGNLGETCASDSQPLSQAPELNGEDEVFGKFDTTPTDSQAVQANDEGNPDNDFGDFDGAPSVTATETQAVAASQERTKDDNHGDFGEVTDSPSEPLKDLESNVDAFGSFDVAPVSATEAQAVEVDQEGTTDDDFGEVTASATQPSKEVESNGDDFDDFDGAPSTAAIEPQAASGKQGAAGDTVSHFVEATSSSPPSKDAESNVDDFGDFDGAPSAASTEPQAVTENQKGTTDDEFGDFGEATASSPPSKDLESNDDGFGDFDGAPTQATEPQTVNGSQEVATDDEFGEFGEATACSSPSKDAEPDFGDFDGAPSTAPTETQAVVENQKVTTENEFGDFGEATASVPPSKDVDTNVDDFGDFDGAPTAATATATATQVVAGNQEGTTDNEFGDFGEARASSSPSKDAEPDVDDFGDFDGAPTAATEPQAEAGKKEVTTNDEFGDFGEARASSSPSKDAEPDANDFGDFDGAPTGAAEPQAEAGNKEVTINDEFGDFGEAPVAAPPSEDVESNVDEFGDFDGAEAEAGDHAFGDFGEASMVSATERKALDESPKQPLLLEVGAQFQRAQLVFSKIRSKCEYEATVVSTSDEDPIEQGLTVHSFLATLGSQSSGNADQKNNVALPVLHPSKNQESRSNLIIFQDGVGGYSHFSYPIGGPMAPENDVGNDMVRKRASVVPSYVPDVLPIQLPTGKEALMDGASPNPIRPIATAKISPAALPDIGRKQSSRGITPPSLDQTKNTTRKGSSEAVKQLMEQIPDLSFMLRTSLSSPNK